MRFSYSKGRLDALVETQPPNPEEAMRCVEMLAYTGIPHVYSLGQMGSRCLIDCCPVDMDRSPKDYQ